MTMVFPQDDVLFSSDLHLWHETARKMREFQSFESMHNWMINGWNSRATPNSHIFILGDVTFAGAEKTMEILDKLNGHLHLVLGNHDKRLKGAALGRFDTVNHYLEVDVRDSDRSGGKQRIVMSHFPFRSWNRHHYGSWHLHGHCHGNLESLGKSMDVGVDATGMIMLKYAEVKHTLSRREIHVCDHHVRTI